jgi:hypothetical protein
VIYFQETLEDWGLNAQSIPDIERMCCEVESSPEVKANWDTMVTAGSAGSLLGKRFLLSRKCGGADEDEEGGCGSGDEGAQ